MSGQHWPAIECLQCSKLIINYSHIYLILQYTSNKLGRLAFAHFLQLAVSFAHILRFQLRTIFAPQSGSISD